MNLTFLSFETENLRCPDFKIDFKKGINFLQMPNGTGKTTLLDLVKNTLSNEWEYKDKEFIKEFKKKGSDSNDGVFKLSLLFNKESITFVVNFDFETGEVEVNTETAAGRERKFAPPKEARHLLTKKHAEIFNFSAQQAPSHFNKSHSVVKDSVGAFSGRIGVQNLLRDLDQRFKAKHQGNRKVGGEDVLDNKLEELGKKIQNLDDLKDKYKEKRKKIEPELNGFKIKIEGMQGKDEDYKNRKGTIDARLEELRPLAIQAESEIAELAFYPNNMSEHFNSELKEIFSKLERGKLPGIDNLFFDEIANENNCICGRPQTDETRKVIVEGKNKYLGTDDVAFVNALKSDLKEIINASKFDDLKEKLGTLMETTKEISDKELELVDLDAEFANSRLTKEEAERFALISDEDSDLVKDINIIDTSNYKDEKNDKTREKDLLNLKASQIKNMIRNLPDAIWLQGKLGLKHADANNYNKANKNKTSFDDAIIKAVKNAEILIKAEIKNKMNSLISKIHTDQNFSVKKIDESIELDGQKRGSGAQEVITVSTFAISLLERSGVEFPLMIDHPCKDIQNEDRFELSRFLQDCTHQCICLVINSEKDGFIRHDETRNIHQEFKKAHFITATRKKNSPDVPNNAYVTDDGVVCTEYEFFDKFKVMKDQG